MITSLIIFSNYLLIILSQPIFLAIISLPSPPRYFTHSALSPSDLFLLSPPSDLSLLFSDLSSLSLSLPLLGESSERSGGEERSEGERAEREESLHVHHDGEPSEVGLILLSSFFFSAPTMR